MRLANRPLEVDGPLRSIDHGTFADLPRERGVVRSRLLVGGVVYLAAAEIVILGGEGVAPGVLALLLVVDCADRFEQTDRILLVHELLGRQLQEPMELPPHRLVLTPMPPEELSQKPGRLLAGSPI